MTSGEETIWAHNILVLPFIVSGKLTLKSTCNIPKSKPGTSLSTIKRWLPHRLSKRQSQTTVLPRSPITQMIFFNQGMTLRSTVDISHKNISPRSSHPENDQPSNVLFPTVNLQQIGADKRSDVSPYLDCTSLQVTSTS